MSIKINLDEKFGLFGEHWRPKVIASLNGQEVKVIKVKGEFPWHHHENEDEFFLVWKGVFRVEFARARTKRQRSYASNHLVY
jgi:mannose-6-phosphate isomerase-like protein (cupin superfamily)